VQHVGVQGPFIKSKWSHIPITFSQEDLQLKDYPHNDAMVIPCVIKGFLVHNVLVDIGSAADIIFAKAFTQMQEPEDKIHEATHPLCGFGGRQIVALGKITMSVTFGYVHNTRTDQVIFDIVDMEYPYNTIVGRGALNAFEAILHPAYLCMKIPSEQGPITVHGSQEAAIRIEGNWTDSKAIHNIDGAEAWQQYKYKREKAASVDQPKPMLLCRDIAEQRALLGSQLSDEQYKTLLRFLFNNKDAFAWSANDLCGVNRDVIEHSLNVDPSFRPRKQRLRKMSKDKAEGARNEVKRLLSANVIREVKYPEWLANTIMVKKANGRWRMCIEFTDLNKACPKDEFPLPRIDPLVDAVASLELMSLLDCYSGYHQIWINKEDESKTSFITPSGTYCYLRMRKGLKNVGGSFSRMTAKVLHSQIVRSMKQENHIADLQETFANFRQAGLKLNPEKCVFGVKKGKFLGCLVSTKGIEANSSKIEAILRMQPLSTKKGAQRLAGRLASLNIFICRSAKRNMPFFEILKSAEVFQWGPAQQKAFEELKQYLIDLTTLTPPSPGAPLLLYVAASHSVVIAALVQEKLNGQIKKQASVYFVFEVLSLSKKNYTELEKVLYAVLMASKKLRHYFQAYHIIVPSSQPLKDILRNREATGRIGKWVAELNEFSIDYVHRSSIQSQALADFIADWTPGAQEEETDKDVESWTVFCDGSWGTFGAGAVAVLVAPSKVRTCYAARLDFSCTNNIAEYEALLLGLWKLKAMGIRRAILKTDSQVIFGHVDKSCKARDPNLEKYLDTVRRLEASFESFSVKNIPRGENEHVDLLAKSAAQGLPLPSEVFFETIKAPSVELMERAVLAISPVHNEDWRTEIISFLQGNCLLDDEVYNNRMEARTRQYVIIEGVLGTCSQML
jgi:ribonuclease HI